MRKYVMDSHAVISALPLTEPDRSEFIEIANVAFERVVDRIEPKNRKLTRALWSPAHYIDHILLTPEMLPISRKYALSLIDAFLVHHVIDLTLEADNIDRAPALN